MAIKYHTSHFNPDNLSKYNIDRQAMDAVPAGSFILDIGCATGFMGEYLKKNKACTVVGLEIREEEAKRAKKVLDAIVIGSIEDMSILRKIRKTTHHKKFDIILATSVIEHLSDPNKALLNMIKLLRTGGKLVITTPNIAHWSIRLSLLRGKFDYTEYGILDETHLHFFTLKTFQELFTKQKLNIEKISIDAEGGGYPRISILLSKVFPAVFGYQMLVVAKKK